MRSFLSRCVMFGLLIGWALSHATVFGQTGKKGESVAINKARQGLDKVVTLDYTGQSLTDALNHFRDKTGLTLNIDQVAFLNAGLNTDGPMGQVELKAKNEKAGVALRRLLNTFRLTHLVFEDSVLITSEEMALSRQFRQRVSVNVAEVPLKTAIQDLARKQGISLVIDPKVKKEADTAITLQLDNTGIETALRLMAELADVKAVRMGNVMFVTTAAKAKAIREEEAHTLENPMNPNMPFQSPPMIGGRFGGGFGGGIAFPGRVAPGAPPVNPDGPVPEVVPQRAIPDVPPPPAGKGVVNPDGTSTSPPAPPRPGTVGSSPARPPVPIQRNPKDR